MSEQKEIQMSRTARLLAIVLLLVLASVGAYVAYNVGFDNGAIAANVAENGNTLIVDRGYGYHGGFGFFPFFWFFPLLFFFLLLGAFRRGPSRWGGHGPGHGWGPPREEIEAKMEEWHRKAHEQQ
jgi:hypothetical protein